MSSCHLSQEHSPLSLPTLGPQVLISHLQAHLIFLGQASHHAAPLPADSYPLLPWLIPLHPSVSSCNVISSERSSLPSKVGFLLLCCTALCVLDFSLWHLLQFIIMRIFFLRYLCIDYLTLAHTHKQQEVKNHFCFRHHFRPSTVTATKLTMYLLKK